MKSKRRLNINHFFILSYTFLFFTSQGCSPERDLDPTNYEEYISISSDEDPAISPDGNLVAYFHNCLEFPEPENYPTGLYVMNLNGSNRRLLQKGNHFGPSWSHDGKWIVFSSEGTLRIISLEGDSIRTFQGIKNLPLYSPDWSMDGKEILFSAPLTTDGGVFKMGSDFRSVRRILDPQTNNGMFASWSPDRSRIVFIKKTPTLKSVEVFIADTALISEVRLTNDEKDDRHTKWAPNGNMITWCQDVRIVIVNTNGTMKRSLDFGQYPNWSPASDYIIYSNANSDYTKAVLWKINLDGSNKAQLTF